MESAPMTKSGENECLLTSSELESEARELPVGRAKHTHTMPRTPARCSPRRALVDGSLVASRTIQNWNGDRCTSDQSWYLDRPHHCRSWYRFSEHNSLSVDFGSGRDRVTNSVAGIQIGFLLCRQPRNVLVPRNRGFRK